MRTLEKLVRTPKGQAQWAAMLKESAKNQVAEIIAAKDYTEGSLFIECGSKLSDRDILDVLEEAVNAGR